MPATTPTHHQSSLGAQAKRQAIQERIPKKKRATNPEDRNLRLTGHNLFDIKDAGGEIVHSKYTPNQRILLRKAWDLNLRDFTSKYERQRDLIKWILWSSENTGDENDVIVIEMLKDYIQALDGDRGPEDEQERRLAFEEADKAYIELKFQGLGLVVPKEFKLPPHIRAPSIKKGRSAYIPDMFRRTMAIVNAVYDSGIVKTYGLQPRQQINAEPTDVREPREEYKRESTYFNDESGGEPLNTDEIQALQSLSEEDVKGFFLDSNVGNLHYRFGRSLMSGKFSGQEETKYLSNAVGSMTTDEQRLLLQYIAQRKRSRGSNGNVKSEQIPSPPPPPQIPTLPIPPAMRQSSPPFSSALKLSF